jgi:hypothetical protein
MSQKPPTRAMRENPGLDQLKRQAKELLEVYRASSPAAVVEVTDYPEAAGAGTWATLTAWTQRTKPKAPIELLGSDAETPCAGGSIDASVR